MNGATVIRWVPACVAATLAACGEPFHEEEGLTTFELPGTHAGLTCEQCHGPPPYAYFVWDTTCLSCHEEDRKTADHYAGLACTDSGCHLDTDASWADNHGVPHDFLPLEGVHAIDCTSCHDSGTPSNDDVFPDTGSRWSCGGCHDTPTQPDRPAEHYVDDATTLPYGALVSWDCDACHDTERRYYTPITGWDNASDHGLVRFPHGTTSGGVVDGVALPPGAWVVDCLDCHTGGPPQYTCTETCHGEIFVTVPAPHAGFITEPVVRDGTCTGTGCHIYGDLRVDEVTIGVGIIP